MRSPFPIVEERSVEKLKAAIPRPALCPVLNEWLDILAKEAARNVYAHAVLVTYGGHAHLYQNLGAEPLAFAEKFLMKHPPPQR